VTKSENNLRGLNPQLASERHTKRHAARTHCKHGHEFTHENTYTYVHSKNGHSTRACITCMREQTRRWRAKRRAA
jgi:hypothetical protein